MNNKRRYPLPVTPALHLLPVILAMAIVQFGQPQSVEAQQDYYWTGNGGTNTHGVREWGNANN